MIRRRRRILRFVAANFLRPKVPKNDSGVRVVRADRLRIFSKPKRCQVVGAGVFVRVWYAGDPGIPARYPSVPD